MISYIKWLEKWYKENCYDEWEHSYGVKTYTLDNPGWTVLVDLAYTDMEYKEFKMLRIDNSDDDWIVCQVREKQFIGCGDITKKVRIDDKRDK